MGKWLMALAATIIGGLAVWWLTSPGGILNAVARSAPLGATEQRSAAGATHEPAPIRPDNQQAQPATPDPEGPGAKRPGVPPRPARKPERLSQSLLLHDGGQEPILDGQASVGAEFTRIGEQEVATLHVNAPGKDVANHAIMSAGERFEIEWAGRSYYLYVAGVNHEAKTLAVRIEQRR